MAGFFRASTSGLCDAILGEEAVEAWLADPRNDRGVRAGIVALQGETVLGQVISYRETEAAQMTADPSDSVPDQVLAPFRQLRRKGSWYVSSLYVRPEFRRLGIGSQLLACATSMAIAQSVGEVSLHVFSERIAAIDLYHHLGLEIIDHRPVVRHPLLSAAEEVFLMTAPAMTINSRVFFDWSDRSR